MLLSDLMKKNKYIECEWWELGRGTGRGWGQGVSPGSVFWEWNSFQQEEKTSLLLQMLLCWRLASLPETVLLECFMGHLRWQSKGILPASSSTNVLMAQEDFCSWYIHMWINNGEYLRAPQVQNPAAEFSKSWSIGSPLFSGLAQLI